MIRTGQIDAIKIGSPGLWRIERSTIRTVTTAGDVQTAPAADIASSHACSRAKPRPPTDPNGIAAPNYPTGGRPRNLLGVPACEGSIGGLAPRVGFSVSSRPPLPELWPAFSSAVTPLEPPARCGEDGTDHTHLGAQSPVDAFSCEAGAVAGDVRAPRGESDPRAVQG